MTPRRAPEEWLDADATAQLAAMREGLFRAADLLETALDRIAALNPSLNAIVAMDVSGARAAAKISDARYAAGTPRALEGIVVTVKDAYDVAGVVNSAGSPLYATRVPDIDAPAVARLREAGALVLGKTNVSEMLGDLQGFNPVYGMTRNPRTPDRTPGGSSAGSAVAVATGMAALDLGSDLCGSIRWPAHCCGVFGFKPSFGAIPMGGHVPPPPGTPTPTPFSTGGPFARSGRDIALAFRVLSGKAEHRPEAERPLRISIWPDDPACPVDPEIADAVVEAGRRLAARGAHVVEGVAPIDLEEAADVFALDVHAILSLGLPSERRAEFATRAATLAAGDRSHEAARIRALAAGPADARRQEERRERIATAWRRVFETVDCVLCPPALCAAIPHDVSPDPYSRSVRSTSGLRPYFDLISWAAPASVVGLPALVAPVAFGSSRVPIGVQIIGRDDKSVLKVAIAA